MKDEDKLVRMIKNGMTCNDISNELNISNKQLYNKLLHLKNSGQMLNRKYYSNGQLTYNLKTFHQLINNSPTSKNIVLTSLHEENIIKMLVISDLHFGNELERPDLVDRAFNYCVKNNINTILCAGDMIDCVSSRCKSRYDSVDKQIKHFLKDYPFDKNILTFAVAGNHDIYGYKKTGKSIIEAANNYRHDIIIGGYETSSLKIKNDEITLFHNIFGYPKTNTERSIVIQGHYHTYKITAPSKNKLNIFVPTLSDITKDVPSALKMTLNFNNGFISKVNIKQVCFLDEDITISEVSYSFFKDRNKSNKQIMNEVNIGDKERIKVYGLGMK